MESVVLRFKEESGLVKDGNTIAFSGSRKIKGRN